MFTNVSEVLAASIIRAIAAKTAIFPAAVSANSGNYVQSCNFVKTS
jgi:hypothetical protein